MSWVRIDDGFADHPKIAAAGPLCLALQLRSLCYAARHLTDGMVPHAVAQMLANDLGPDTIRAMVTHGLWHEEACCYRIHDYLEYNPSKSQALQLRDIRKETGRKGGLAKAKQIARGVASQRLAQSSSKTPSKTLPRTRTRTPKNPPPSPLTIDTLTADLNGVEAYRGLDVRGVILRCEQWCQARGYTLTKMRVVSWLNKDAADHVTSNGTAAKGPHYLDLRTDEDKRKDADRADRAQPRRH